MRTTLERISPLLLASVMAGGFVVSSALPATADAPAERLDRLHAERPIAASDHDTDEQVLVVTPPVDVLADLAQLAQRLEAARQAAASRAAATTSGSANALPVRRSCNGDVACFLACTRSYESDTAGGYAAVSPGGAYRGAYQFAQGTWNAVVGSAGYPEYVGIPADQAPPEVQDAAAIHLYSIHGNQPWGGRC